MARGRHRGPRITRECTSAYDRPVSSITPVTAASRHDLPPPCVSCVFWQHDRAVTDERRKEGWSEAFPGAPGAFGRVVSATARVFRGMIQYGPSAAFPRALALPAGPPESRGRPDHVRVPGGRRSGRGGRAPDARGPGRREGAGRCGAVEAFALSYPDSVAWEDRFVGHHTLFDRELPRGARLHEGADPGPGGRCMRLELGGWSPGTGPTGARGAPDEVRRRRRTRPRPEGRTAGPRGGRAPHSRRCSPPSSCSSRTAAAAGDATIQPRALQGADVYVSPRALGPAGRPSAAASSRSWPSSSRTASRPVKLAIVRGPRGHPRPAGPTRAAWRERPRLRRHRRADDTRARRRGRRRPDARRPS